MQMLNQTRVRNFVIILRNFEILELRNFVIRNYYHHPKIQNLNFFLISYISWR